MPLDAAWPRSATSCAWNHSAQSCRSASCSSGRPSRSAGHCGAPIAERGKQSRAAHRDHGDAGDAVAAQAGIAAEAVADRHIHAIGREIRQTTRGGDVELDIGMPRAEAAEPRHQPGGGERRRRTDRQHAGIRQCPQPTRRLADLAECVADRREIVLACLGQHQRAVAAAEQLCAQPLLQSAHQLAHRARRHRQFGRRLLHAEMAGGGLEGAQGVEGRQTGHGDQDRISQPNPP